jgi:hypothetical protein
VQLSFAQVEEVLSSCHKIREDRRSAFANRLKNYQKAEFPHGINTGRGRAASYNVGHLWQLAVALELNQIGLNPEQAITLIRSNMLQTLRAATAATRKGAPKGKIESPICLCFDPAALLELAHPSAHNYPTQSFKVVSLAYAKRRLGELMESEAPRLVFVNVSGLVYSLATWGRPTFGLSLDHFYSVLYEWAMEEGGFDRNSQT